MASLYGVFKLFLYNASIIYCLMVYKYPYSFCQLLGACSQSVSRSNLNDCCINSLWYTIFCFIFVNFMHYAVYLHFSVLKLVIRHDFKQYTNYFFSSHYTTYKKRENEETTLVLSILVK